MSLSDVAIKRPVFTAMMSVTLLVLGIMGYRELGTDLFPEVSMPFVTVTTVYPGAGPVDIEQQVTRPIEDAVAGIQGVERAFSQSRESVSLVFVQFKMKVPIPEAVQQVRDKVGIAVANLPRGSEPPIIAQFDLTAQPVLIFSASGAQDSLELRELLDDKLRPRLEQIEGVAAARIVGGGEREVAVELFPDRLAEHGLTVEGVLQRIGAEHLDIPAGRFQSGSAEVNVRVRGQFENVDALREMVVKTNMDGSHLRLAEVAFVRETRAEPRTLVRTNGQDAVAIEVVKQAGKNTIQVAEDVRAALAVLEKELKIETDVLVDQSVLIEANAHEVWLAIYFGGAMAILIILLFLLDLRGTIISALALPTSVVGTLFAMYALGYTLNQLTMLGLSLAIGLLIDDAVVVRESITKRLEAGESPEEAASNGTKEIALAVLATTFTLAAVFVPVAFMQGMVGQFFRQFGLTITAAVMISLFVAFTLDPMLSARFAKRHAPGEVHRDNAVKAALKRFFDGIDAAYGASLGFVLHWRKLTVFLAFAAFVGSLGVGARLGSDFIGAEDRGDLIVSLKFPPGTSLSATSARSAEAEKQVLALPGVTTLYAVIGPRDNVDTAEWRVRMVDKNERKEGIAFFKNEIRRIAQAVPQATVAVSDPPVIEGLGAYPPIIMHVIGPEFGPLRREAEFVRDVLVSIPGTADVMLHDNPGKPELQVVVDRDMASRMGLPAGLAAMQVRLAANGEVAGKLRQGRRESEIRVRVAGEDREGPDALSRLALASPAFRQPSPLELAQGFPAPLGQVSLGQVARLETSDGPSIIEHEMRERQISITAEIAPGADLGSVVKALRARLDAHALPPGYIYFYDGQQKDMADMTESLGLALGLALVFIFMVLASQFESLVHPFTIMISLPLALVGAVLALALTGNNLGMGANIGVILLMGLVTKNAILLVDGALQNIRDHGMDASAAMRAAGPRRLRPILMTSAAMALGMLPTAIGTGVGSEFRAPMAISVIGGVITSTLLTLWVVPVVFVWIERARAFVGRRPKVPHAPPTSPADEPAAAKVG